MAGLGGGGVLLGRFVGPFLLGRFCWAVLAEKLANF